MRSRAINNDPALDFLTGPEADRRIYGLATIAQMYADRIEHPAKALHDLSKCMLDENGELRRNTLLLDEHGHFIYDNWQEAAELIAKGLRAHLKASGHPTDIIDQKQLAYLTAIQMICIEHKPYVNKKGDTMFPEAEQIHDLLNGKNSRSFIGAVLDQDELDKLKNKQSAATPEASEQHNIQPDENEQRSTTIEQPAQNDSNPLYDNMKRKILADSGRTEAQVDTNTLERTIAQAIEPQLAQARKDGFDLATALVEKGKFTNIDTGILEQYMAGLALEAIGGADPREIEHRTKLHASYPSLPETLQEAQKLNRGSFAERAGTRKGTTTPEGITASKPTGREIG